MVAKKKVAVKKSPPRKKVEPITPEPKEKNPWSGLANGCLSLIGIALLVFALLVLVAMLLYSTTFGRSESALVISVSQNSNQAWAEESPQDGHVVVGQPQTEHMTDWLHSEFNVVQAPYRAGTELSQISGIQSGTWVSFHMEENHRDWPQDVLPDIACFGTVIQYDPAVHGNYKMPSRGNVVIWNTPEQLPTAIRAWNTFRQSANPGWNCDYPESLSAIKP